jgi:hypothetical protein
VELPGEDHTPFTADAGPLVGAVREFLIASIVRT